MRDETLNPRPSCGIGCGAEVDFEDEVCRDCADVIARCEEEDATPLAPSEAGGRAEDDEIAAELLRCAESWEPDACLLGNVRAREIVALCRARLASRPSEEDSDRLLEAVRGSRSSGDGERRDATVDSLADAFDEAHAAMLAYGFATQEDDEPARKTAERRHWKALSDIQVRAALASAEGSA